MNMKTVWLTSMVSSEDKVKNLISQLKKYGLDVKGHFWEDDLKKMAWIQAREELIKPEVALWLIFASNENLLSPSIRYGLSLLAITIQARKGLSFPVLILPEQGETPSSENLPTPLKGFGFLSMSDAGMPAKIVAKVHTPVEEVSSEYRLDVYGNPQIGQWFEIGPRKALWSGAMFGVAGADITFHAVGPKGSLPSESTLNYPSKGLKLNLGEKEYTAWAVQNEINEQTSYFIRVDGFPESIVFGQYSIEEESEVFKVMTK
jgi:hypothetical protein